MAREHGVGRQTPDTVVPWRVFGVVGVVIAVLAAIYWFTSYEEAGTAMLTLAAALALWAATYLWRQGRLTPAPEQIGEGDEVYLPHESVWPFAIGCGAFLLLNGLLIGGWFFLPGGAVMVMGLFGFIRQTRERS
ncbi:MAG: cytochrome c oxidase subunit 4 [Acidimicrobiia bacterium]|nr:cytochrome c oxidase subunit 4 [Acidimicrobiia bacterium]